MKNILPIFLALIFLTSCTIGTQISGHHGNIKEDYPDIRTVPQPEEALKDRQNHQQTENVQRNADLEELKQDLKSAKERDQQLRNQTAL